ncbi:hypothetical protein OUZ56_019195 [Daphnia magna]|uniref:Uncharacterized protein n=1 Tax=Daphnia magna TaxID=35525 RepID=A0ABQ9ZAY1_9CRUS|nr:hypothetical protein OUZ56_019195 [Daphnia magna]
MTAGKEEEEEKRKFIYLSLRCDEDAALASSAESGACRTGNPSRPAPDDNDILRSSCVSSCERKFLDGDNQKHLSARKQFFFVLLSGLLWK